MHCPSCECENPEEAKFCNACGRRLTTERAPRRSKTWHPGKILLLWAIDLMIGGMVLWSAYRPGFKHVPAYIPYQEFGVWLALSFPLFVLTWWWLRSRERQQRGENSEEGKRRTRLNLERGFRRLTWLISIAVLIAGAVIIVPDWWATWTLWNQAGGTVSDDRIVVVSGFHIKFSKDATEAKIKEALDRAQMAAARQKEPPAPAAAEEEDIPLSYFEQRYKELHAKKGKTPAPASSSDIPSLDEIRQIRASSDKERDDLLAQIRSVTPAQQLTHPVPNIAYVYQPSSGAAPSVLYSRKALLHAEAKDELAPETKAILTELRAVQLFPSPLRNPFGRWAISEFLELVLCASVPWAVFFLVRWIVLGFTPN